MPNETQDLIFNLKANTSNAEQGMGKINRLTDDLKITTEKTSGALREFAGQLKQARDLSDVAGMATKALGQVLGASLGGTAVLVAGKALIDAFNTVQTAVKETEGKVKDAFKEIDKAGLPKTFQESAMQADKLSASADAVSKKIQEIEANPLQKFIAGLTGAKEKMDELVVSTQKAAQERIKLGVQTAIADEEFQRGLSDKDKALNALFKSYQDKADQIAASMMAAGANPEEIKKVTSLIFEAHATARRAMLDDYALKEQKIAEENATKATDLRRANDMAEFELQQKSQNTLFETERARLNEQIQTRLKAADDEAKKREESAKIIEEYHKRLFDLTEKRVALEERLASSQAKLAETKGKVAAGAAGLGGTMRGTGQRPTSYELGLQKAVSRAEEDARRKDAEAYRQYTQDKLIEQKFREMDKAVPTGLTKAEKNAIISPEAVQMKQKQDAIDAARAKVMESGTAAIKKHEEAVARDQAQLEMVTEAIQIMDEEQRSATEQTSSMKNVIKDTTETTGQFADSLDEAIDATQKFSKATSAYAGGAAVAAPTTSLSDIYDLLDGVLSELVDITHEIATYSHAT